jgi:hypothetical protein
MPLKLGKTLDDFTNQISYGEMPDIRKYFICSNKYITITSDVMYCPICNKTHKILDEKEKFITLGYDFECDIEIYETSFYDGNLKKQIDNGIEGNFKPFRIHEKQEFKKWILRKKDGSIITRLKLNTNILQLSYYEETCNEERYYLDSYKVKYSIKLDNIKKYGDIILIINKKKKIEKKSFVVW